MSSKIPKTGLANILRDWMKSRAGTKAQRRFTIEQICESLAVMSGKQHQQVANVLCDFVRRGEVATYKTPKRNRRQYLYNREWKKRVKGSLNKRIYKAMYVSGSFVAADIQRLAGVPDSGWVHKVLRTLKKNGLVQIVYRRPCAHGIGVEAVWHIQDRDRFKIECRL